MTSAIIKAPAVSIAPEEAGLAVTDILGVHINAIDMPKTVETIEHWIDTSQREFVTLCNVHSVMEADRDPAFRDVLNNAGLRVPDGMPLVWLSHRAGQHHTQRIRGADLVDALCARSAQTGHRHYFYGGTPGIAQEMSSRLQQRHPGLKIAGAATPGKLAVGQEDDSAVVDAINRTKPDILWVGLGCPKQERWTHLHRAHLDAPIIIPVGAAFGFHSGAVKQAPMWMQRNGLEWVHRMGSEPGRLANRYFRANSDFVFRLISSKVGGCQGK